MTLERRMSAEANPKPTSDQVIEERAIRSLSLLERVVLQPLQCRISLGVK
jgi:hypothetical protein